MIEIKLKNEKKVLDAFKLAPKDMKEALMSAIDKTAVATMGATIEIIHRGTGMWKRPIDTGAMWQGIGAKKNTSALKVVISTSPSTGYAIYVHEGTRKMRKRPFFEITAKNEEKKISKIFINEIEKAIKKLTRKTG